MSRSMRVFRAFLLFVLSFATIALLLISIVFFANLNIILILLILSLAINCFTSGLGILVGCRTTIIATAMMEIMFVLILVYNPLLTIPARGYIFAAGIATFVMLIVYALLLLQSNGLKRDTFVWATATPTNKRNNDELICISPILNNNK